MSMNTGRTSRRDMLVLAGRAAGALALSQGLPTMLRAATAPGSDPVALKVERPTPEALAPFGGMLGKPFPEAKGAIAFRTAAVSSWRQQLFDVGKEGEVEIVWVDYKLTNPVVNKLERHYLTEQAVVPLVGEIIQILALSTPSGEPDVATMRAFRVPPGTGVCMGKGVWHTTRSLSSTCLMLTRGSTSVDILKHREGAPLTETVMKDIRPYRLSDPI
jgi:ureidoglycolate lyase